MAECARLLARTVAHYQMKYGELPLDEKLALIDMTKPNEEQIQLMTDGMEILVRGGWVMLFLGLGRIGIERLKCPNEPLDFIYILHGES